MRLVLASLCLVGASLVSAEEPAPRAAPPLAPLVKIVLGQGPSGEVTTITRVERLVGPDGVARLHVWPPEVAPSIAESMGFPLERVVIEPPAGLPPAVAAAAAAAREPRGEDTPETVTYHDWCQALAERGISRGGEVGGIAAFGVRVGGKGQAPELGEMEPAVSQSIDEWNEVGALVVSVVPGAPADLAGLVPGDVIVQAGPFWIDTPSMLIRLASRSEVGREIELLVLRRGQVERTWITPIDRKDMEALQQP